MSLRLAGLVAAAAVAAVTLTAAIALALGLGAELRHSFGFEFRHPRDLHAFGAIALNNARVAVLPFAAALVLPYIGRWRSVLDALLALLALGNCVVIGLALGAYGGRLALNLAAHGPLELAGMSLALATYLHARTTCPRRPLGLPRSVAGCAVLILSAAALEVWVS
jgi:hypothetical protein